MQRKTVMILAGHPFSAKKVLFAKGLANYNFFAPTLCPTLHSNLRQLVPNDWGAGPFQ